MGFQLLKSLERKCEFLVLCAIVSHTNVPRALACKNCGVCLFWRSLRYIAHGKPVIFRNLLDGLWSTLQHRDDANHEVSSLVRLGR